MKVHWLKAVVGVFHLIALYSWTLQLRYHWVSDRPNHSLNLFIKWKEITPWVLGGNIVRIQRSSWKFKNKVIFYDIVGCKFPRKKYSAWCSDIFFWFYFQCGPNTFVDFFEKTVQNQDVFISPGWQSTPSKKKKNQTFLTCIYSVQLSEIIQRQCSTSDVLFSMARQVKGDKQKQEWT